MLGVGPLELVVIFIVALIVIGPKKMPEVARALGKAIGEFKRATSDLQSSFEMDLRPDKIKRQSEPAPKPHPAGPVAATGDDEFGGAPEPAVEAETAPSPKPKYEEESHHHD